MKPVEIYIFRHGETDWNRERRLQGHTNTSLNSTGRLQAKELAQRLYSHPLELIITSDLQRAFETAQTINEVLKAPLIKTSELRECRLGEAEGLVHDEILARFGKGAWDRWLSITEEDKHFCFPGGQTKMEHAKQLMSFLESFFMSHAEYSKVGISTHGGSLVRIVHSCLDSPLTPVPGNNCAIYRLLFERETRTWRYQGPLK